ncbi:MAG: GNAT family N-acetyltransferase [Lachnospiraceae bacterium]|nr:GNAT family N-acetyltransferase [Lachnospiraceae bacterium]
MSLYLRKANERDKKKLFDWANESETRANSFHQEKISWEEHTGWYDRMMQAEDVLLYIAMDFMKPVGQVRLNIEDEAGRISYSVDEECRGDHLGQKMLALLEKEVAGKVARLVAEVKPDNMASRWNFEKLGYELYGKQDDSDQEKVIYVKDLDTAKTGVASDKEQKTAAKKREPQFEILRVAAMLMVILLHYLSKGGLLANPAGEMTFSDWAFWGLEALCLVCVNVYVLISGYFFAENRFRLGKAAGIWCQVFFYSVVIAAVCMAAGIADYRHYFDLYNLQFFAFPVINGHYWFASAYLLMYLFSPVMNYAIKGMRKKQFQMLILLLLIPFSFAKSILPLPLTVDDCGNSFIWFLCLYLIAAYIRLYGIPLLEKKGKALITYLLSATGILVALAFAGFLNRRTGHYEYALEIPLHYNFVFILTGSLGLFYCFKTWKVKENALVRYLVRIAPYTFGVYLLHEHLLLRYWWPETFRVSEVYGAVRIFHLLLTVILLFAAGILVDVLRSLLFLGIDKLMVIALRIYYAKREAMDYLIFGFLATLVNWIAYAAGSFGPLEAGVEWIAGKVCDMGLLAAASDPEASAKIIVANVFAWIIAVLFAYWTNRTWVFRSQMHGAKAILKEFATFVSARITSLLVETVLLYILVDWLKVGDMFSKILLSFVTVALNYIFSKLWIFKKKEDTKR